MTDYRRPVLFGWFAEPDARASRELLAGATIADRAGLDLIGVQDHPYNAGHLDALTLLSGMAAVTERIRLFPDVANLPLRGPTMLGRAIAGLDAMSGGRAELGLGAGAFWDGIEALGGPRRTPGQAVDAMAEALDVLRPWLDGRAPLTVAGEHYTVRGAHPGPPTAHRVGLWMGALGPRMLRLLGERADGWLPSLAFVPPEKLAAVHEQIDTAAQGAGRDPASIERIYNVWGDYSDTQWIDLLTELTVNYGMNGYVFGAPPVERELRRIGDVIAPAVREAVAAHRGE